MASEKNITMRQYNGVDYDTLYPKTKVEQVVGMDGYFTKDQTLSSSVAALYGLSGTDAIPNNVFNQLYYSINGTDSKLYQWNRWKWSINLDTAVTNFNFSSSYTTWYIAQFDSITFNKDGTCTGQGRTIIHGQKSSIPSLTAGKYYSDLWLYQDEAEAETAVPYFYNPSYGRIVYNSNGFIQARDVFQITDARIKTTEIVTSTNPNAYTVSDTPDAEGWYYEKLPDIPLSPPLSRFYSSSYTGTGTYGEANPNTIICPGKPLAVFIRAAESAILQSDTSFFIYNQPTAGVNSSSSSGANATLTWADNSISWYNSNALTQLNTNNKVYYYFIIVQS